MTFRLSTSSTYAVYAEQAGAVRQFGDPTQVQVDIGRGGVLKQRKATANEYHPAKTEGSGLAARAPQEGLRHQFAV